MEPQTQDRGREETKETSNKPEQIPSLAAAQEELAQAIAEKKARAGRRTTRPTISPGERIPPLSEADAIQEALVARREKIYPREVHGFFANWRVAMVGLTLGVYYFLPWINWGANRQAFLIDLPGRKFNLFFWTFWPQDLFYLTAILIISALSLFLFTAVAGRLWCGFICPQTVWTEIFLWIERKIEGDRPKQMKLAEAPWNLDKIVKRTNKHAVWLLFSAWTGFTFVGYFTPIRELSVSLWQLSLGPWETFWILFYGFATYGNAGWLREQVCIYMCPYARFQSAMFDRNTLIISYDPKRGEPRGPRARTVDRGQAGLGDCIDCTLCVQVCPTGIDIRNGLQYQCIACAACVDVCNSVMDKMQYPRGLIRYTTENEMEGRPQRLLRPRVIVYTALLAAIGAALLLAVVGRVPLELDVIRDRNTLFRETDAGLIENAYTLKIMNMDANPHTYSLKVTGIEGMQLRMDREDIRVASGEVTEVPISVRAERGKLASRSQPIRFRLQAREDAKLSVEEDARFLGPVE